MTEEEIENYFVESAGYGRDKVRNFMDIVNKALKQKGEHITELEKKVKNYELAEIEAKEIMADLQAQIEKMKCCGNCNGILDGGRRAEKCRHCMDSKELSEWELAND